MVASAKGHNRAERACSLEKKRSDDRDDLVRKFLMEGHFALGQSLDLNVWQSCHGLDFGARARRRLIAALRRYGRKNRKSNDSENLAKVDF